MDIDVRDTGTAPIIAAWGKELGIIEAINETVKWDKVLKTASSMMMPWPGPWCDCQ